MKICMIGHKRIPGREGGIEVVVEELSTRMVDKGHDVTVFNRKSKKNKKIKNYKGVKIKNIFTIATKSLDATIYTILSSIRVCFSRYNIIHFHGIGMCFMLWLPKLFRKKIVVTVHGLNYKTPKWKGLGAKIILFGEKMTAKYANLIVTLSSEQQKYFLEKYNRETILIPNGTNIKDVLPPNIIKQKWGLDKDQYILFLSRVVPGKGLELLIEAYLKLDIDIPLIVAGDYGYSKDFYESLLTKIGNSEKIRFIGFVKGDEIAELFSNTKLFVFPSEAEGMPMCLLEALSYNAHCLISDIPENVDVAQDYAITFKVGNLDDLVEKLKLCLEPGQKFKESRQYIIDKYNWNEVVDKTIRKYEEIL